MSSLPDISLIIPTHNRAERLRDTLAAVAAQTVAPDRLEVIVVDDGGSDAVAQVVQCGRPLWRYVPQSRQGATLARNRGVAEARGRLLVFMDDDIEPGPEALAALARLHERHQRAVIVGTLLEPGEAPASHEADAVAVTFTDCFTGLLSVTAEDFAALGQFQDITGGWPNWDDIYFGYRAERAGLAILRSPAAWAVHHDASAQALLTTAQRLYRAGRSAARLFAHHPDIRPHLPMFADKTPVDWRQDRPILIARKAARRALSAWPMVRLLTAAAAAAQQLAPGSTVLRLLHQWVLGGYIYQGYRQGLRDLS